MIDRLSRERTHGKRLAEQDPERAWGWGTVAGQRRAARRARLIAQGAALGPGVRVLEVGCGTGTMTSIFAGTGASVVALELSPDLLGIARRNTENVRVEFVLSAFEEYHPERLFDAIVGSSVLHHLHVDDALRRLHQLLAPGGRIAFAEPNLLNPQVWLERTFRHVPPFSGYVSPDETAIVRWTLRRTAVRAGFTRVDIRPFDWLHPRTPLPLVPLVERVGSVIESVPVLREIAGSLLITAEKTHA